MSWRYTGRARVNPRAPEAFGRCDRCGFWWNLRNLQYQYDYQGGPRLVNLRLRVCPPCYDKPAEFLKPLILPPDPLPVVDPRTEPFAYDNSNTNVPPPLPFPVQAIGPPVPNAPAPPSFSLPPPPTEPADIFGDV
jgi:hypothetical protein